MSNTPSIGALVSVRGIQCKIFRIHPLGTIDVVSLDGNRAWRISGLQCQPAGFDRTAKAFEFVPVTTKEISNH